MIQDLPMATFAVSPQQRRLWLLRAEGRHFDTAAVVEIEGPLDAERLARAAAAAAERHEVLRTAFHRAPGLRVPRQVVSLPPEPAWEGEEAGEPEAAESAATWLAGGLSWDLESGPVVRVRLVRTGPERHLLLAAFPALVADAATAVVWADEVARLYATDGGAAGASPADDEPLQYGDLADWQNELLEGDDADIARGRAWWRRLELPAAEPLPGDRGAQAAAASSVPERVALSVAAWGAITALAERLEVSWQAVPLAAWAALLARLTGRDEAAVAVLFDGRRLEEVASALGPLSQALPMGWRLDPGLGFAALAREVERSLAAVAEQQEYYPGASEGGSPEGGEAQPAAPERPPYGYAAHALPVLPAPDGLSMRLRAVRSRLEPLALELVAILGAAGSGELEVWFDPERFERAEAETLAARLESLLADAAERPEAPVDRLEVSAPRDRRALAAFQPAPSPAGEPMLRRFERHAARQPEAEAVVAGPVRLTYGELEQRANRLARRLLRLGAGPERPVALHLDRSADVVVSLLASLKAGAPYVPVDPTLPISRRARLLAAVRPAVVVDGADLPAEVAGGAAVLHPDAAELAEEAPTPPAQEVPERAAAYVLFTSGSTGEPKGVVVERGNLWSYTEGVLTRLDLPDGSRYAVASTFAADLGNTMIFAALASGGGLHVLPLEGLTDAEVLAAELAGRGADCLKLVPSHLAALLAAPRPERLLPRRCLVLGGEVLPQPLAERVQALAPGLRVLNHYGPTETTVGVLTHAVAAGAPAGDEPAVPAAAGVPLGRPLPGSGVHLLDPRLRPVPPGVRGEIAIGGAQVARGYLDRARETAERFVPDPLAGESGARLYRSGDLGRLVSSPEGGHVMSFEGRRDDQVKIRGFRIEPGEVEAALARHPAVAASAVAARGEGERRRLAAWVVFAAGAEANAAELREHLGGRLPEPMVPSVFMPLAALPLTPNGKLDRRALPEPGADRLGSGLPFVAPRNELESHVATIWSEVLGVERVGLHDSFFDLGGTSLTLVQVHGRLQSELGAEMPVVELFRYPTVGELARFLAEGRRAGTSAADRRRQAAGRLELLRRQRAQRGGNG